MTRRELRSLLLRTALFLVLAIAVVAVAGIAGLRIPWPLPVSLALVAGAGSWLLDRGVDHDDQLDAPALDLDADYALPHAQDTTVRRLEEAVHGAQPRRRMTSRALARTLGEIAEERERDPEAPPLPPDLARLIATAREPDAEAHPVGPIDRRTLHRYLHQLAAREERER
ncbi:hypothetical protein [Brachybacterium aquaticum]|uniref:Uncharacterized protein n=1 Tax=Brachybacterium aquaticum TaxID=1432564 RepID=A0A841AG49_9MICO|nr:hypothetical protein [Brachybacterium aquaticum]MBB5832250.1 hypothetical protein [Brachybacterium aquaticum]